MNAQSLEIAVLRDSDSRGGSSWIHRHLKPGDRLRIRGPRNHFRFDEDVKKAIFIVGGIGITPIIAMARRAKESGVDYGLHYSGRARGALDPRKEHAFEVELKDSGIVVTVPADQTLLAALRGANIDVQSDCCEGLCGSCEVRVLAGEVDHRDLVLTRTEREENRKMMACCSRAAGTRIVLEL